MRKLRWNCPVWLENFLGKLRDRAEHFKVTQHPVLRCEKGLDSGLYSRV